MQGQYYKDRVPSTVTASRSMSKHSTETDAELDARYEAYFSRADIDGWEIRKVGKSLILWLLNSAVGNVGSARVSQATKSNLQHIN